MYNLQDMKAKVEDHFSPAYFFNYKENHAELLRSTNKISETPEGLLNRAKERNIALDKNALDIIEKMKEDAKELIILVEKYVIMNEEYYSNILTFKNDIMNENDEVSEDVANELGEKLISLIKMKNGANSGLKEQISDKNFDILFNLSQFHEKYLKK